MLALAFYSFMYVGCLRCKGISSYRLYFFCFVSFLCILSIIYSKIELMGDEYCTTWTSAIAIQNKLMAKRSYLYLLIKSSLILLNDDARVWSSVWFHLSHFHWIFCIYSQQSRWFDWRYQFIVWIESFAYICFQSIKATADDVTHNITISFIIFDFCFLSFSESHSCVMRDWLYQIQNMNTLLFQNDVRFPIWVIERTHTRTCTGNLFHFSIMSFYFSLTHLFSFI